jgi:hypothetical protein
MAERLTEHANVSKHSIYQLFSGKNELVAEHLGPLHEAGGVSTEPAIGTTDASPRSRALALDSTPAVSGVHFTTPPSREGKM